MLDLAHKYYTYMTPLYGLDPAENRAWLSITSSVPKWSKHIAVINASIFTRK